MKRLLIILLAAVALGVAAQRRAGVAYYDLEGLYDTVPSPFYNDEAHTPAGVLCWTADRYEGVVKRFAALIDSLAMPLMALRGVETEQVALDLAARSRGDYCVVHSTLNSLDGLDFALLYQGDRFLPGRVEAGSGWMSVEGELDGCPVVLLLCRKARFLEDRVAELRETMPYRLMIVLGDTGGLRGEAYGLRDVLRGAEQAGRGNRSVRGYWRMEDRILADSAFRVAGADVYAREWLFDRERGVPLPLYEKGRYRSGYARKLPVFAYLFR